MSYTPNFLVAKLLLVAEKFRHDTELLDETSLF